MTYKLSTIASILGVKVNPIRGGELIATLLTDSRSLTVPEKSMFFALKTAGNDGHRYISDLYNRGVRYFVVEYRASPPQPFRHPGSGYNRKPRKDNCQGMAFSDAALQFQDCTQPS